ncbi:MAG: hypothetical protein LiPW30_116 [Parcubacteria group bacterium LiPW_30]|nr:MAG: hypothetical protein LiPW30_116 [Parcubacteria group bacterium LiPW_30]
MIQKAKKKTSFLLSILVTGILGTIGGYISSNYSKDSSFLVPVAKADVPFNPFGGGGDGGSGGDGDGGSGGGDGGGDCSSSGDGGF